MSEYSEKLRGIGFLSRKGTSDKKPVIDENTGKVGGYHVEHWNDAQDAVVMPEAIRYDVKLVQGER